MRWVWLGVLLGAGVAGAAPRVQAGDAARVVEARAALVSALAGVASVDPAASAEAAGRAEAAMATLRGLVDGSFHGVNLRDAGARVHALALRAEVAKLMGGAGAPMVLVEDVVHFRPAVHRALAEAAMARGAAAEAVRHWQAVVGVARDDRAAWVGLRDAHLAGGDRAAAAAVEAMLARPKLEGPVLRAP